MLQIQKQLDEGIAEAHSSGLSRNLGVKDLAAFGIAAIVGAGIFSTIGQASADGGPAVIFLFIFTAIACGFAALAYAEFASRVPVSGSAYTYAYVAFGELVAWVIGWALIMEYAIGNITVAISWSDYFTGLLRSSGMNLPEWITMDYLTANKGFNIANKLMAAGKSFDSLDGNIREAYLAFSNAPHIGPLRLIADLPALLIITLITWLVYRGIEESRKASNIMVFLKLCVVVAVIIIGAFLVDTRNWHPFAPNGIKGVLAGVSAVFFAYIGFDAISTTAEECKNPQRDLPRGMLISIVICTLLYCAIVLVLTGMVSYKELAVGDPLAYVFEKLDLTWLSGIVSVSALIAIASVLLVFQLGQPRIWMSMSRDGLLPAAFSRIHKRFKTPSFATIVTGFVVAVPSLFLNLTMVTDLCSIGTLFAFVVVCAGVLRLGQIQKPTDPQPKFKIPYVNGKWIMPLLVVTFISIAMVKFPQKSMNFVYNVPQTVSSKDFVTNLPGEQLVVIKDFTNTWANTQANTTSLVIDDVDAYVQGLNESEYQQYIDAAPISLEYKQESGWSLFAHKIPTWIFFISLIALCIWSFIGNLSLIPQLGLVCCLYMMSELGVSNWIGFSIWLVIGLLVYFNYGWKKSKLAGIIS